MSDGADGLRVRRDGAVLELTVDRPERRNALHLPALRVLAEQVEGAAGDGVRVVVVTGAGGHLSAGADLGGVEDVTFLSAVRRVIAALRRHDVVTVVAAEGVALGLGLQLAISCDLRVAAPTTRFGIPAAKLGISVDHDTVRRLAEVVGDGTARAMLLGAVEQSGTDAHAAGWVQRLGTLDDALAWAHELAALAPLTQRAHKLALERRTGPADDPEVEALRAAAWASDDLAEGRDAFAQRRPPVWRGR